MMQRKKKRSNFRRYTRYAKGFARSVGTVSKLARDVNYLRSVVNVERKYIDITATTTSTSTAALVLLNGLSQGTSAITRNGQSIKMTSIFFHGLWTINASAATTIGRVLIILDTQANGAAPAAADVLVSPSAVLSPLVIGNGKRFIVLSDIRVSLSINGTEIIRRKKFMKCGYHVKFNTGNAGTIADIQTNSLYMLHVSDNGVNAPSYAYWVRTRFVDN